jgi:hypothetical protein
MSWEKKRLKRPKMAIIAPIEMFWAIAKRR